METNQNNDNHFIAFYTQKKGGMSPDQVKQQYNYQIKQKSIEYNQEIAYNTLSEHIKLKLSEDQKKNIIVVSEDIKLVEVTTRSYDSSVHTIYISGNPTFVEKSNISYIGVDQDIIDDYTQEQLDKSDMTYFTMKKIKQLGILSIVNSILEMNKDCINSIHLVIDLNIIDPSICPSVERNKNQKNFLTYHDINQFITLLKHKVKYLDILGFNEEYDDNAYRFTKITGETCRYIIRDIYNIKENAINIFSDDSKFLIYRNFEQLSDEDIGWKIVRFMTLQQRELFISKIDDNIINLVYDETDGYEKEVMITTTSVNEQNEKSYFVAEGVTDMCLEPQEKMFMVFELLNSVNSSMNINQDELT